MLAIYTIVMMLIITNAALALDGGYEKWAIALGIAMLIMAWNIDLFI